MPLSLEDREWMLGLTSLEDLEVYFSVFRINKENKRFESCRSTEEKFITEQPG